MATTIKRLTYDDLEAIPQEREGDRHEIIAGELVVTPAPIPKHQDASANIFVPMHVHVVERQLGKVYYAPIDIRFAPANVVSPDIVFVARDRLHIIGPQGIDGSPDLVVEILSPGTRRRDRSTKRDLYARFGVREYWIVDLGERTVTVLGLVSDRYEPIAPGEGGTIRSRVLPGLVMTLDDVFTGMVK